MASVEPEWVSRVPETGRIVPLHALLSVPVPTPPPPHGVYEALATYFGHLGHGTMMAAWWRLHLLGYPGVPETLQALGAAG